MKKKTLTERLNRYFAAEEKAIDIPPLEAMRAYRDFHALAEAQAPQPAQKPVRRIRVGRSALLAACLAVVILLAVVLPAFINRPGDANERPQAADESVRGEYTNKTPDVSRPPAESNGRDELSEGIEATDSDIQEEPGVSSMEAEVNPDQNGDGMGGGWEEFEAYFPEELYNLYTLSYIVTWEEIHAAESKLLAEDGSYQTDQLPPLYLVIRELNISKEDFIRARDKYDPAYYTDEQIEWLFSDADIQTVQAALKRDTTLVYNGRLYNPNELLRLEDSLLRKMANTKEMTAYLAGLDDCRFAEVLKHRLEGLS